MIGDEFGHGQTDGSRREDTSTMGKRKPKTMRDHATDLAGRLAPHVESAQKKAGPMIADAQKKAAPVIADAQKMAAPVVADARDKFSSEVLPVITAAVAAANEATEDARGEAKKRGKATAAALRGELEAPVKKKHRFRKFLLFAGLAGAAAVVAKSLSDRQASTAWQSTYTPTPAPVDETPTATAAAAAAAKRRAADDEGASAPDEAAADAGESPHQATTPDNPADEVQVDKK
jgi:cell division septum initiation protein DivIVA